MEQLPFSCDALLMVKLRSSSQAYTLWMVVLNVVWMLEWQGFMENGQIQFGLNSEKMVMVVAVKKWVV